MEPSDFALLVTLDALLQESSVTKAARRVGLSTPAMSHALARIRERLGDPLLVRAGRNLVLTPRAEALRPRIRSVVAEASHVLAPEEPFSPNTLSRSFVIRATDHVLTVMGVELDKIVQTTAPQVTLRFVANSVDDAMALREGSADLAVGIYADLPPELRSRLLMTDRFVSVVREDHPSVKKRLSLDQFLALEHVQVAPRGRPGGYLDNVLSERGLSRKVARAVPFFLAALQLTSRSDYVLTISERIARIVGPSLRLRILEPPLELQPYALKLVWHPRFDGDPGHAWLREAFLQAVKVSAGDLHENAQMSLERTRTRRSKKRRPTRSGA